MSICPTFNFGAHDITPFTCRSVIFQCKSKNLAKKLIPGTMIRPAVVHYKSANTYESAMRCIAKKCNLENKGEIYIITYGEPASIAACLKSFINKDSL